MARQEFANYKPDGHTWITLAGGEYYPDILGPACELYKPVLVMFGHLVERSESSIRLFLEIASVPDGWMRIQLSRVFKKYVSPSTPVEMLKQKNKAEAITEQFGQSFRPIQEVQAAFTSRPIPDEALCAVLWEYKDRGKKGYDLTERFFEMIRSQLPDMKVIGPERAGKDILMGSVFSDYPNPTRPVDFAISKRLVVFSQSGWRGTTPTEEEHRKTTGLVATGTVPTKSWPMPTLGHSKRR